MFNWAIIGCGNIASTVGAEILSSGRHNVAAVYSRTSSKAEVFAAKFGAKAYTNIEDCIRDKNVDGVYIATPHSAHYDAIITCLNLGKPIICEKPLVVNFAQAERCTKLAKKNKVYLLEALWTRFQPIILELLQEVRCGTIGKIQKFYADFSAKIPDDFKGVPERLVRPEYAGGSLLDLGVYTVALAELFLGSPISIKAELEVKDGIDIDNTLNLYYDNCEAVLTSSLIHACENDIVIIGSEGLIRVPRFFKPEKAEIYRNGKLLKTLSGSPGYIYMFDKAVKDIGEGKIESEEMSHEATLQTSAVMDKARTLNKFYYPRDIEKL